MREWSIISGIFLFKATVAAQPCTNIILHFIVYTKILSDYSQWRVFHIRTTAGTKI